METTKSFEIRSGDDLDICPVFSFYESDEEIKEHMSKTKSILLKMLPREVPFKDQEGLVSYLKKSLPLFTWLDGDAPPSIMTVSILCKPLTSLPTETFFQEMLKRWLVPHQETTILSFHHMLFYFEHYLKEFYFIAEAKVLVKSAREYDLMLSKLPLLKTEMEKAISLGSFAKSILETKALPVDRKSFLIREGLLRLLHRFPDDFDERILQRFAYAQAYTSEEFKSQRSYLHLTRLMASMYLIRNHLERSLRTLPEKRHMTLRFIQTKLIFPFGQKPVLGMVIGLNLFHKFEFFEEKHILLSVQKFFPSIRLVSGSFYRFQQAESPIITLYVELEKEDGSRFFPDEVSILKEYLVDELSKRIEHLVPSLFMVRNEEEIMRNILLLSQELKQAGDLPQVMISFDQQSQDDLIFTVVLLRIKDQKSEPIQDLLSALDPKVRLIPDRVQNVRYLEKDYPIEANVFRLELEKLPIFLRMDFSVNLYLARLEVVNFLTKAFGEFRDYNGGMILKQGELLTQFKRLFQDLSTRNQELLENFFYSLNPIESQATIPLNCLSRFFTLFLELANKEFSKRVDYDLETESVSDGVFALMRLKVSDYRSEVENALKSRGIYDRSIVSVTLSFEGAHYLGYYFPELTAENGALLDESIKVGIQTFLSSRKKTKTLKLATVYKVSSFDPRIGGDFQTSVFVRLLFDGLMRRDVNGLTVCAVAKSYSVTKNQLRYTFQLRESFWSDGSKLVAYDFEYAWKKILSPDFSTPFSLFFRPILNAQKAKMGEISVEEVGVKAIDDKTLVVDLEYQAPYFIELTAHTLFSPVNHRIDKMHPNWSTQNSSEFICNGPFKLKSNRPIYNIEFEKNPYYWKSDEVYFDQIVVNQASEKTSIDLFKQEEIDYLGAPFQSFADCLDKIDVDQIYTLPFERIFWICFNTQLPPFSNLNFRIALASSLKREEIIKHYNTPCSKAFTPLPPDVSNHLHSDFLIDENETKAKEHFQMAIDEMGIKKEDLPLIHLSYGHGSEHHQAIFETIRNRWEKILGIKCVIESYSWKEYFSRITSGRYQIGIMKWASWLSDPIYTLDAFKYRSEGVNFPKWENNEYKKLLELSEKTKDFNERQSYLAKAEEILIKESPVIPICYEKNCCVKSQGLQLSDRSFSMLGNYDFSQTKVSFSKK